MNTYQSHNTAKTVTAIVTVIAIVGIVILIEVLQNNNKATSSAPTATASTTTPSANPSTSNTTTTTTNTGTSTATASAYKDGTYTADAEYYVPHGDEDIKVTLTISNGVVTDSSIVNSESDHDSLRYQEEFASAYKAYVVGKNLADIKLSYVAGASDTTDGFNDALSQIQTQAKA